MVVFDERPALLSAVADWLVPPEPPTWKALLLVKSSDKPEVASPDLDAVEEALPLSPPLKNDPRSEPMVLFAPKGDNENNEGQQCTSADQEFGLRRHCR